MIFLTEKLRNHWKSHDPFNDVMALTGDVFRNVKNRKTLRFSIENKIYFAKLHWGVGWKEIFKNWFQLRLPILGAKNEWLAIQRLEQLHIPTTPLVGYGARGNNPAQQESFVITQALLHTLSLEDFCRHWSTTPPPIEIKRALINKVALIARDLHENGVNHRDFYLCHFLLDISADVENISSASLKLYLIDLHRVQLRKKTPVRWKAKDISGLYFSCLDIGLTQRDLFRFIKIYTHHSLRKTLHQQQALWEHIQKRAFSLYEKTNTISQQTFRWFFRCQKSAFTPTFQTFLMQPDVYINNDKAIVLKHDATTTVVKVFIENRWIVVKRYNIKSVWHAIKRSCQASRAQRCWDNAWRLVHLHIPTAKPIAMIEKRSGFLRSTAYFITEYHEGSHAAAYFSGSDSKKNNMAKKVIALLTQLKNAGISHGDLKATNILLSNDYPLLIDLDGMRKNRPTSQRLIKLRARDEKRFMRNWTEQPEIQHLFSHSFNKTKKIKN